MKTVERIWKVLDQIVGSLSAMAMGGMVVIIFSQVVFRYMLKAPLSWSEELARYLFVWAAFLGSVVAARKGQHVGVELLISRLKGTARNVVLVISNLLTSGFFALIFWNVLIAWPKLMKQKTPALKLPMAYPYLGLAVGCFLMCLSYFCAACFQIARKEKNEWA